MFIYYVLVLKTLKPFNTERFVLANFIDDHAKQYQCPMHNNLRVSALNIGVSVFTCYFLFMHNYFIILLNVCMYHNVEE